jgi:hypothetical protein
MPQHAKRIKVRRKDLRKPDEFETLTGQALDWADEHRTLVGGIAVAVALVALLWLGVGRWRASRNEAAGIAFRAAHTTFTAGKFGEAAPAFAELAETYPSTPFGRLARLYRAHALARQGDGAGAVIAYQEFLASTPGSDYLRQEALTGLGHAKEVTGDATAALEAYTEAGNLAGPYRTEALLGAARLHEAGGHGDKAREIYASLAKEAPDAETRALLASKLPAGSVPASSAPAGAVAEGNFE